MPESRTIMVVDDKRVIRDVLCTYLEHKGYKTVALNNGHGAISYVRKQKPDLVILDLNMPGLDGIETCRRLKKVLPSSSRTGIMVITGNNTPESKSKVIDFGAIDVINKPFDLDDVDNRIKIWFEVRNIESGLVRALVYSAKVNWHMNGAVT